MTAPVWLALAMGAAASATACLKPHFIMILVIIELALLVKSRDPRSLLDPEAIAFFAVILAYLGHWLLLPAAARHYFFGRHLQLIAAGYSVYARPLEWVFRRTWLHLLLPLGAIVSATFGIWRAQRSFMRRLMTSLIAGIMGGLISYMSQQKGWSYHRIPMVYFSILAIAAVYCQGIHQLFVSDRRRLRRAVVAAPLVATLLSAGGVFALVHRRKRSTVGSRISKR